MVFHSYVKMPDGELYQWEFQDPVLCHIRSYIEGIFPYIALTYRPYIWYVALVSVPEMASDYISNPICLRLNIDFRQLHPPT